MPERPSSLFEKPMRYLCLVYVDESKLRALSQAEIDAIIEDTLAYDEALRQSGHYIASDALQPVDTATTLRMRNGKVSIRDGPFAVTAEQLGGFVLIEARDLNEAMHVAAKIPPARLGSVEVRPVLALTKSPS